MPDDNSFLLTFYPTGHQAHPDAESLGAQIHQYPGNVHQQDSRPIWNVAPGAVWYSIHQEDESSGMVLSGPDQRVLKFVLHLLGTSGCNACLEVNQRPVLTQLEGDLRLDLQRFWTPELLASVRSSRAFTRARVLYDFPKPGFYRENRPEPNWESRFEQALANLEARGDRFDPQDPAILEELERMCEARLKLKSDIHNLKELRGFLHQAARPIRASRPVLPAVLIGGRPPLFAASPPWVQLLSHQHGGYHCLQSLLSGVILPLQANRPLARLDPGEVLDAFEAMGEEPDHQVLKSFYPKLAPLTQTRGEPYGQSELDLLHQFLSQSYQIPRFTSGREALLEFEPCEPLDWFAGWKMGCGDPGRSLAYNKENHQMLQEWYEGELRCYFLWSNSD